MICGCALVVGGHQLFLSYLKLIWVKISWALSMCWVLCLSLGLIGVALAFRKQVVYALVGRQRERRSHDFVDRVCSLSVIYCRWLKVSSSEPVPPLCHIYPQMTQLDAFCFPPLLLEWLKLKEPCCHWFQAVEHAGFCERFLWIASMLLHYWHFRQNYFL